MNEPDRFQNRAEKEIFFEALDKNTPEERAAFLDGACGKNPALRARVEGLLADHFQQDAFMKKPAVEGERSTIRIYPVSETAGTVIGRYKLLQQIGEGGCGVVYMAEQQEPVSRRVALKVIKLGMDTKGVIARFEAERQALAMMDHPNIAKVLDAGATETGRPYFVMELVRGTKITDYCDQNNLSTRERLDLFIPICHAIQHAHQKGIIHRDIKPSNVLVTMNDGVPMPKVIDFGIAKATTGKLTDQTLFTAFEQFIGTPAYMSPEQAEMSALDIDTRSDIYSLGVLLYELLTGQTPFNAKDLLQAGLDEIRRTIREQEPARPSTCLSTMQGAELTAIAKHRKVEAPGLLSLVRGDLDWIVMKALEKDRTRRYETASGLAADVKRHLENEPVIARPPSTGYRLQKAFRRNKLAFGAGVAVVFALVAGLALAAMGWRQTQVERDKALRAQAGEEMQRKAAQEQAKRAETRETEARRLLYVANMSLIQQAWDENNLTRLRELLDETQAFADRGFEWYYWQRQTHLALVTLRGHASGISAAAFSPDGKRIVTSSWDRTAKMWDAASGTQLLTFKGHSDQVTSVAFSPDGQRIATGSGDHTAKVWDATSGKELVAFKGHTNWVSSLAFSPDGQRIVTGAWDHTAKEWDAASGRELLTLTVDFSQANSVAFSPDGQRIATGSGGKAEVWDAASGRKLLTVESPSDTVAFSPDGRRIVAGGREGFEGGAAKVLDAATGLELLNLKGHSGLIWSAAFSPDGQRIVTGSADSTAKVWDAASGQELLTLIGHVGWIRSAAFSPDGRRILTGSDDRTAKVWAAAGDEGLAVLEDRGNTNLLSSPVAFSLDGQRIVTLRPRYTHMGVEAFAPDGQRGVAGGGNRAATLWDAASGRELLSLKDGNVLDPVLSLFSVAISPDGRRIVIGNYQTASVWDAATGLEVLKLQGHSGRVSVAFSPDGQRIVTRDQVGPAKVWDAASGRELFSFKAHSNLLTEEAMSRHLSFAAFSPDGRRIVILSMDQTVELWDVVSGRKLFELTGRSNLIDSVAFSPDSERIATGSGDPIAKVWDTASGQELFALKGHTGQVNSVAFSSDGRRIVTGSADQTAKLWDAATGRELLTLKGHNGGVSCVAFSPDGRRILTGSADLTAKLWDAASGRELLTLKGHHFNVPYVAFSPNGQWIVTGRFGRGEKVWEAARPEQIAQWRAEEEAPIQP